MKVIPETSRMQLIRYTLYMFLFYTLSYDTNKCIFFSFIIRISYFDKNDFMVKYDRIRETISFD